MFSLIQRTRFAQNVRATWGVLLHPRLTFRQLRERKPLLAPWVVVSLLSAALTLVVISISQRATAHLMADLPSSVPVEGVEASLERAKIFSVGLAPFALFDRWMATAVLVWALAVFASSRASYRATLSIVAYSATPQVLGKGVDVLVNWIEGPEFTPDMIPVFSSATSLAAFFPNAGDNAWASAFLQNLSPFSLWGLALWAIGLREMFRLGWGRSLTVAVPVWAALWAGSSTMYVLGRSLMGTMVPAAG
jgi:hypothetical protein